MKIAVTYQDGNIFQHFGHSEQFKLYDVDTDAKRITSSQVVSADGFGHESLVLWLRLNAVTTVICGGFGAGAQNALTGAGIKLCAGVSGSADDAVRAFLAGTLAYQSSSNCSHHDHEHSCGDHNCDGHCSH